MRTHRTTSPSTTRHAPRRGRWPAAAISALLSGTLAVALALPAGTASAAVPVAAVLRTPAPQRYAAIGDSYSAGVGTGRDDLAGPPCERSSLAFPRLWTAAHPGSSLAFLACSGSRTSTVRKHQVSGIPRDATLVTVTAGGNDVAFSAVVAVCTLIGNDHACGVARSVASAVAVTEVPLSLTLLLLAVHRRAPHAQVVVLGYPHLFELGACSALVPTAARRAAINKGTDLLDDVLARTARALGARFVDVRARFAGHGVCAPAGQAWINGPNSAATPYHPTATGQARGYLPALTSAVG